MKITFFSIFLLVGSFVYSQSNRIWATYYGGEAFEDRPNVFTDLTGNIYLSGHTASSTGIAYNGFQNSCYGGNDAFLVKFDSSLNRIWATYYGGFSTELGLSAATDVWENVYLAGQTASTAVVAYNGFQNSLNGTLDAFLVKFDSSGNRLWATYYGGPGGELSYKVVTDGWGNVYIAGQTNSNTGISFNGFQNSFSGGLYDGILVKFDSSGHRLWATYYGGNGDDRALDMLTLGTDVYISGYTTSTSGIASGGFQNSLGGSKDAYLVKFDSSGSRLWATYYGGPNDDMGFSIDDDSSGNIYLAGRTASTSGIASGGFQNTYGGGLYDAFIVKFDTSCNRIWATYYGGPAEDIVQGSGIGTDSAGHIFLSGESWSSSGISYGGFQDSLVGTENLFVAKFDSNGNRYCATYYGQAHELDARLTVDVFGNVYLTGITNSTTGIAYDGFQNTLGGGYDAVLVKFSSCNAPLFVNTTSINVLCYGQCTGAASVNALSGNAPYSYLWSNSQTTQNIFGLCAGTYFVTITDSIGTTGTASVTITQPLQLSDTTSSISTDASCIGTASIVVNGGTPPYQFIWSNSSINDTINNLCSGWYYVTVTDANNCEITDSVYVPLNTGINDINASQNIFITPNPTTSEITIYDERFTIEKIEIHSSIGEKTFSQISNLTSQISIDIGQFLPGIYFITVTDQAGNKVTKKVVKM